MGLGYFFIINLKEKMKKKPKLMLKIILFLLPIIMQIHFYNNQFSYSIELKYIYNIYIYKIYLSKKLTKIKYINS